MTNTLNLAGNDIVADSITVASNTVTNETVTTLTTTNFSVGGVGIYVGAGAPSLSATKGSLYLNTTGSSSSTRLYVNNGTTTWIAVTTAS